MIYSLYARLSPTEEVFLQTSDELPALNKQSKYVYTRWMGEMGLVKFDEDTLFLQIYKHGYPYIEAPFAVPRRVWVPCPPPPSVKS